MAISEQRASCEQYAADHLHECAAELIEWHDTALLCNGRIRELAAMCAEWTGERDALRVAERMVERAALKASLYCVVAQPPTFNEYQVKAGRPAT